MSNENNVNNETPQSNQSPQPSQPLQASTQQRQAPSQQENSPQQQTAPGVTENAAANRNINQQRPPMVPPYIPAHGNGAPPAMAYPQGMAPQSAVAPAVGTPYAMPKPKEKHIFTLGEKQLLLPVMFLAILFDRLVIKGLNLNNYLNGMFYGLFWLCFQGVFCWFQWGKIKTNRFSWMLTFFTSMLCIWSIFFDYRSSYGLLNMLVIPGVIMAHMQYIWGGYRLKQVGAIAWEWLLGWIVKFFSAIHMGAGAVKSIAQDKKNSPGKHIVIGVACALIVLAVVVPLLAGADMVFNYYLDNLLRDFSFYSLFGHCICVVIFFFLFYSLLWNSKFAALPKEKVNKKIFSIDVMISYIVLGTMLLVYILFCAIQFTYLFAGAGLPDDMTYSEYAREGFWQIIVIAAINFMMFGILLQYSKKHKGVTIMLAILLVLTGIMLISSFVRLRLYINIYGLSWLRLLSGWFIFYLAAVLVLCFVRMAKEQIPLIGVCAALLLGWYSVLGYCNPDSLIIHYNLNTAPSVEKWVSSNYRYIKYDYSDEAIAAIISTGLQNEDVDRLADYGYRRASGGYSIASHRSKEICQVYLEQYAPEKLQKILEEAE